MKKNTKQILSFLAVTLLFITLIIAGFSFGKFFLGPNKKKIRRTLAKIKETIHSDNRNGNILSAIVENVSPQKITPSPTPEPPTPTPIEYTVSLVSWPDTINEGDQATFTWNVNGLSTTIHKTAVYFGAKSSKGMLGKDISPDDSVYSKVLRDFLDGDFVVPLRFVGNQTITLPATYFARAYALVGGKHYWSQEQTFVVKPVPKHEIQVVSFPDKAKVDENITFTWEILGPKSTTGYTIIAGGKESKSEKFDRFVEISQTPYEPLVKDFTDGTYNVPFRYVGNTKLSEPGKYFFRAFAYVNDKNIWSDEFSLEIE